MWNIASEISVKTLWENSKWMVYCLRAERTRKCSSVNKGTRETREQPISTLQRAMDLNSKKRKENSHFTQACFQNKELLILRIQISKRWVESAIKSHCTFLQRTDNSYGLYCNTWVVCIWKIYLLMDQKVSFIILIWFNKICTLEIFQIIFLKK